MIQDSGNRREFGTGAVRDCADGKGRCDLLPLDVINDIFERCDSSTKNTFSLINNYVRDRNTQSLITVIVWFSLEHFDSIPNAMLEVAIHMEEGCKKYGERNFESGIPLHCYIDSALRHYLKFLRGDKDERHDRAFLWNLMCCLWTERNKPEMDDLPVTVQESLSNK